MTAARTQTPDEKLCADVRALAKPCPFCGGGRILSEEIPPSERAAWRAWLLCDDCRATGPAADGPHGKSDAVLRAVTAWNRAPRKP